MKAILMTDKENFKAEIERRIENCHKEYESCKEKQDNAGMIHYAAVKAELEGLLKAINAAKESQSIAKEAQNIAKEAIGTVKELKKELYDNVTTMAVLRGKVIAWKGACLLFAGISAVELLFLLTH